MLKFCCQILFKPHNFTSNSSGDPEVSKNVPNMIKFWENVYKMMRRTSKNISI